RRGTRQPVPRGGAARGHPPDALRSARQAQHRCRAVRQERPAHEPERAWRAGHAGPWRPAGTRIGTSLSDALLLRVPRAVAASKAAATPAVVLGSGVGALGALRRLRHAGVPAYLLPAAPMYESRSRWGRPVPGARGTLAAAGALATLLEGSSL